MSSANLTIPLFPLPDAVLFPQTVFPLHVFEPRYKEMISNALEGEKMLGIAQLSPGWHDDYFGAPGIYKVLGVGQIVEVERWSDGRYDILVRGLYRASIVNEIDSAVYRQAEVHIIEDIIPADRTREIDDVHELLLQIFDKISNALPPEMGLLPGADVRDLSPGMLTDVLASLLVNDAYERQSLLSEPDVARRQQLLRVQIQTVFNPDIPEE